jgi:hypothetical protein
MTLESLRQLIRQLPGEQRQQLRSLLDEELQTMTARQFDCALPPVIPPDEFAAKWKAEPTWLENHQREYAGRWVALDGERLVTAGASAREVYAALKAAGISGTLVTRVEHPDDLPVIE